MMEIYPMLVKSMICDLLYGGRYSDVSLQNGRQ